MFEPVAERPRDANGKLVDPWVATAAHAFVIASHLISLELAKVHAVAKLTALQAQTAAPATAPMSKVIRDLVAGAVAEHEFAHATADDASDEAEIRRAAEQLKIIAEWGK